MVQMNRRNFIGQAGMTAVATGLAINGFSPPVAEAQLTGIVNYLWGAHPILGVLALFEMGYSFFSHINDPKISDITTRINETAQSQNQKLDLILDQLTQTRLIVRDELNANNMKRDMEHFSNISYHLRIAAALGRMKEIEGLRGDVDEITNQLKVYGVAGSSAYLSAVALQTTVHSALGSGPKIITDVNTEHEQRFDQIIYDGNDPSSLEHAILVTREKTYDPNYKALKDNLNRWHNVGIVTKYFEGTNDVLSCYVRYTYKGFKNGEPDMGDRAYGENVPGFNPAEPVDNGTNFHGRRMVKATYTVIGTDDAMLLKIRPNGSLAFPDDWPSGQVVTAQVKKIADGYKSLYRPDFGPEISSRTSLSFGMTAEQATLKDNLINVGLGSIKGIIARAYSQPTLAPVNLGLRQSQARQFNS